MRNYFLGLGLALFCQASFAVETVNCPPQLRVKFSEVHLDADSDDLMEEIANERSEDIQAMPQDWVADIRSSVRNLHNSQGEDRSFALSRRANGRCRYSNPGNIEKIELYTSRGVDRLMMQTNLGPRGILTRLYAKVTSYSPTSLTLEDGSGSLALAIPRYPYDSYTAGGPLVFVGKANTLLAEVPVAAR